MNKEMREMDGAFGQSGQCEGLGCEGEGGGVGSVVGQTKKSFQALKTQLTEWAHGGQNG